jgi:hypothetical protein
MGKKSRAKKNRGKDWVKASPDEIIGRGPLRIERYGRYVRFSNISTPAEHADFLKHSEEANKRIVEELEREVPLLQSLVQKYDPVELMHRAAYMLLPLFIKYKSEYEYSSDETYYLPTVEYLQYIIARTATNTGGKDPSEAEWQEVWEQGLKVLRLTGNYLFTRKTSTTPPSDMDELGFFLSNRLLMMRVDRYPMFLTDYLMTSLSPYEQWIKEIYGVGVPEIIKGLQEIDEYQKTGVLDRYRDSMDTERVFVAKLREKGYAVDPGASDEEIKRTQEAFALEEFKDLYADLQEKLRLTFTPAIFDITDLTSLPKSVLSLLSVRPGESILATLTGPNHDDLSPLSTSVLHYKPFLELDNRFYTFYHSGFEDRIAEIVESDLFQKRPNKISEMAKRRSDRIESDSKKLLASILKPDFAFQNVYYPNPDKPGDLTELDILLGVDDILFLVEVKAGGFPGPASRGAPKSLGKELYDLIIEGQHQSERAEKYIKSAEEVSFFDETGKNVVHKIEYSKYRRVFRIVITNKNLGWIGAQIAILSVLDPNLSKSFPWHISIDDLRIAVELFKDNEISFVHFLEQRLKASAETRLSQHDEIEHIALYNKINYYHELPVKGMDQMTFTSSYMQDIDAYFMEKTAGGSPVVPTQAMPHKMRDFINALRDSHLPSRFEVGSIILSMDTTGRNEFQEQGLDVLDLAIDEGRQRTFRMPFRKLSLGLSITYGDDAHWQEEMIRSAAQMEQSNCKRWLVVQMKNESPYRINRIERILPGRFSEEALTPAKLHLEAKARRAINNEKPGRNDKCPCGSGKKYKMCHGR